MAQNQILASIYAIMQINDISIDDINKFYAQKQTENTIEKEDENTIEKEDVNLVEKKSKSSIKWGDEAVDLDERLCETACKTQKNSWVTVVNKKTTSKPLIKTFPSTVTKQSSKKQEEDKRTVVYTVKEFVQCIKEKKKLHIDFTIHDSGHCQHTFNGTLCDNVKDCGMIHIQRCINNLDCKYKNCQFLHADDMSDEEAYENYMYTMDEYNKIKKNKKVYV